VNRFLNQPRPHGNVTLNFRHAPVRDLAAFADGYREAARLLAGRMAESAGYADYEGYPIVFLYRHALELYLKALVYRGAELLGLEGVSVDTSRLFRDHRLKPLLAPAKKILSSRRVSFEGSGLADFSDLQRLVSEVEELDPDSFTFRYPIRKDLTGAVPHHTCVDVLGLARALEPALDLLEGICIWLEEAVQGTLDAKAELEEYFASSPPDA
jgi:hypothetical protein